MIDRSLVAEIVERTTREQGVPRRLSDPRALQQILHILGTGPRTPGPRALRRTLGPDAPVNPTAAKLASAS